MLFLYINISKSYVAILFIFEKAVVVYTRRLSCLSQKALPSSTIMINFLRLGNTDQDAFTIPVDTTVDLLKVELNGSISENDVNMFFPNGK